MRFAEVQLADITDVLLAVTQRETEGATDQRSRLVHQALAARREVRAADRCRAIEERLFILGRTLAEIRMRRFLDDGRGAPNDRRASRRMECGQAFGEDRNVAGADLEESVAAERASLPALKVPALFRRHLTEETV